MTNYERTNEAVIGEVAKNRTKTVRVVVADFEERPFIHLEVHGDRDHAQFDFTIAPRPMRELMPIIEKAIAECSRRQGT